MTVVPAPIVPPYTDGCPACVGTYNEPTRLRRGDGWVRASYRCRCGCRWVTTWQDENGCHVHETHTGPTDLGGDRSRQSRQDLPPDGSDARCVSGTPDLGPTALSGALNDFPSPSLEPAEPRGTVHGR